MRLNEFAFDEDIIEDEAEYRGDGDLLTTLYLLISQSAGKHLVPRVRVDSLINMVNMHGDPDSVPFTNKSLEDAFKTNKDVKNLIADIKDDEQTGIKYVYLNRLDEPADGDGVPTSDEPSQSEPEKIVSGMADKAIAKRS